MKFIILTNNLPLSEIINSFSTRFPFPLPFMISNLQFVPLICHLLYCQHPAQTLVSSSKQKLELDTKFTKVSLSLIPSPSSLLTQTLNSAETLYSSSKQKLELSTPSSNDFRFQITDYRLQISDYRFQISDFRFQISDFRFLITDYRLQITDYRFQISDFRFQISDFRFQYRLQIKYF